MQVAGIIQKPGRCRIKPIYKNIWPVFRVAKSLIAVKNAIASAGTRNDRCCFKAHKKKALKGSFLSAPFVISCDFLLAFLESIGY